MTDETVHDAANNV